MSDVYVIKTDVPHKQIIISEHRHLFVEELLRMIDECPVNTSFMVGRGVKP